MKKLKEIKASYDWFVARYEKELADRMTANDSAAVKTLEEKHDILERGFFVVMFGQFEVVVNEIFSEAVSRRSANPDWNRRRGWDSPHFGNAKKVPFNTRLSMVMDRGSPSYLKILQTYDMRNHCAHGGMSEPVASIDALFADLYNWQAQLRK